jgi:hypothetical protein
MRGKPVVMRRESRPPREGVMRGTRLLGTWGILGAMVVLAGAAGAGTRTYVALAGRDDTRHKLGRPGIRLRVEAENANDAAVVRRELARELAQQVHTRELAENEPGDYDLAITVRAPHLDGSMTVVPFEALLASAEGESLWRIEGRSDVDDGPLDAWVFAGIGRNVVSALIHDGWLQPRYDPDNPPPQPPYLRQQQMSSR